MKPIKTEKMPKWLESDMRTYARRKRDLVLTPASTNLILAALEYERQRAEEALDFIASQSKDFVGLPRGRGMDAFLATHGRQTTEDPPTYSAEHRRKQTAAVVPKAKGTLYERCECGHERGMHASAVACCGEGTCKCERFAPKRQRRD